jgi:hypothetical protein
LVVHRRKRLERTQAVPRCALCLSPHFVAWNVYLYLYLYLDLDLDLDHDPDPDLDHDLDLDQRL